MARKETRCGLSVARFGSAIVFITSVKLGASLEDCDPIGRLERAIDRESSLRTPSNASSVVILRKEIILRISIRLPMIPQPIPHLISSPDSLLNQSDDETVSLLELRK